MSRVGSPAATNTTPSQARAIAAFARPCRSRKSRPSRVSGTSARPTSFETTIAGPASAATAPAESGDFGLDVPAGEHQVRQPQGQAVDERDSPRAGLGGQGLDEIERLLARRPAAPARLPVAGDAVRHLRVAGLRRRQIEPFGRRGLGEALGVGALAGARAAEHQNAAGLDWGHRCIPQGAASASARRAMRPIATVRPTVARTPAARIAHCNGAAPVVHAERPAPASVPT